MGEQGYRVRWGAVPVTNEQLNNLLIYVALWLLMGLASALAVSVGAGAVPPFQDGQPFAAGRTEIAAAFGFLAAGLGTWLTANRPKLGTEETVKATKKKTV